MVFIAHPSELLGTLYPLAELRSFSALCRRLPDSSVPGRRTPRLWPGRPRHRRRPGRHRAPHRCLLHRRHQMRSPLRRGGRVRARRHALSLLTHAKQHGALLAKGASARRSSTLFTDDLYGEVGTYGRCGRRRAASHAAQGRLHLLPRKPHQPAVRRSGKTPRPRRWPSASASAPGKSSGTAAPSSARHQLIHHPDDLAAPRKRPARGDAVAHDASACRLDVRRPASCAHGKPQPA